MAQTREVRGIATSIRTGFREWYGMPAGMNGTHVRYHNTDVVSFDSESIVLRTGGWRTKTTMLRMNQTSNQFGLGYRVFQKKYAWFVDTGYSLLPFDDNEITWKRSPYAGDVACRA